MARPLSLTLPRIGNAEEDVKMVMEEGEDGEADGVRLVGRDRLFDLSSVLAMVMFSSVDST
jgi:hypothetical protein